MFDKRLMAMCPESKKYIVGEYCLSVDGTYDERSDDLYYLNCGGKAVS